MVELTFSFLKVLLNKFSSHPGYEPEPFGLEVQRAILCVNATYCRIKKLRALFVLTHKALHKKIPIVTKGFFGVFNSPENILKP